MRTILAASLACVCVSAAARADDRADALAVIDRAIQAQGGADALATSRTAVYRGEGFFFHADDKEAFTGETTLDLPERWRRSLEIEKAARVDMAVAGDRGWEASGGKVEDLGPERLKELRVEMYVEGLLTLLPLRQDGVELAPLPDSKVDGRPAVGVKASGKGRPDVKLYFDRETHLPVKLEWTAREAGTPHAQELLLGDYQTFDGVRLPTRRVGMTDGRKTIEWTSLSYQFPAKPDDAAFMKP